MKMCHAPDAVQVVCCCPSLARRTYVFLGPLISSYQESSMSKRQCVQVLAENSLENVDRVCGEGSPWCALLVSLQLRRCQTVYPKETDSTSIRVRIGLLSLPASTLASHLCVSPPRSEEDARFGRHSSDYTKDRYQTTKHGFTGDENTHVWVGVIDEGVQQLNGLPHAHASPSLLFEVLPRLHVVCNSLFF